MRDRGRRTEESENDPMIRIWPEKPLPEPDKFSVWSEQSIVDLRQRIRSEGLTDPNREMLARLSVDALIEEMADNPKGRASVAKILLEQTGKSTGGRVDADDPSALEGRRIALTPDDQTQCEAILERWVELENHLRRNQGASDSRPAIPAETPSGDVH